VAEWLLFHRRFMTPANLPLEQDRERKNPEQCVCEPASQQERVTALLFFIHDKLFLEN
jgi:hypothetical protein